MTPLDFLPRRLGLFLWALLSVAAENVSNDFGFIRFEKGEIFWKKTKGTAEGTKSIFRKQSSQLNFGDSQLKQVE